MIILPKAARYNFKLLKPRTLHCGSFTVALPRNSEAPPPDITPPFFANIVHMIKFRRLYKFLHRWSVDEIVMNLKLR